MTYPQRKGTVTRLIVAGYLAAIVLANLAVTHWGPRATIYNAFLFIGYDLVARDRLHDSWKGRGLLPRMGALILAGSLLSYAVNRDSGRIALASCIAFGAAAIADTVVYHLRRRHGWYERSNDSNVVSAAVDSLLFPTIAFGVVLWPIIFGQFTAKVAGGAIWARLLVMHRARKAAAA